MIPEIYTIGDKKKEKILRAKAEQFDFKRMSKAELTALILRMKKIMHAAHGIGLAANQIGLSFAMFVAQVPTADGGQKFYAIFNPKIEKKSNEDELMEEGCLSIPGKWGLVSRANRVTLSGFDKNGKEIKIKAWGLLAHVFQHETDHLKGGLFIDKAKKILTPEDFKEHE